MNLFLELLRESVIMRGILAVLVVGAWVYMTIAQQPVPDAFMSIGGVVVGYFFGSRPVAAVERAAEMASLKARLGK